MNEPNDKAVVVRRPGALAVMAGRLNVDPAKLLGTLQNTCFKGATSEEMLALVVVANEYHLNPLLKEMYAFPAKGGGITPVVGIDGWVKIVNRQDAFDGVTFSWRNDEEGRLESCTCTMHVKGRNSPVVVTEYLSECSRNTEPWSKMPRRMLRHKAFIQAARLAFGLSGIQDEDEAHDVSGVTIAASQPVIFGAAPKALPPTEPEPNDDVPMSPPTEESQQPATHKAAKVQAPEPTGTSPGTSPQEELMAALEGVPYDDFVDYSRDQLQIDISACGGYEDIPSSLCERWLKTEAKSLAKAKKTFGKRA